MELHESYGFQAFESTDCFLCGFSGNGRQTEEHVFPKWLQREFSLWDQTLTLLNGTHIRYRDLRVPCCADCNAVHLSSIESQVSNAVRSGYDACIDLDEGTWYLWVAKLFYGVLRKEVSLFSDRSSPSSGTILTDEFLRSFSHLHQFLQGVRGKHHFSGPRPYVVMICRLHDLGPSFDFRDDLFRFSAALKMNDIGIIVCFEDGGLIRQTYANYVHKVAGRRLHPIQFWELYARVSFQTHRRIRPVSYLTSARSEGEGTATTSVLATSTELEDWDHRMFVELLKIHLAPYLPSPELVEFEPPDRVSTWLHDEEGYPLLLSREDWGAI